MKLDGRIALITGAGSGSAAPSPGASPRRARGSSSTTSAWRRRAETIAQLKGGRPPRAPGRRGRQRAGARHVRRGRARAGQPRHPRQQRGHRRLGRRSRDLQAKGEARIREMVAGQPIQTHWDVTENMTDEAWHRMIGVHLNGTFFCTREALAPHEPAEPRGDHQPVERGRPHGARRGAALQRGQGGHSRLHARGGPRGGLPRIRVNAICPGYIDTPMTEPMSPLMRAAVVARTPLGRWGEPPRTSPPPPSSWPPTTAASTPGSGCRRTGASSLAEAALLRHALERPRNTRSRWSRRVGRAAPLPARSGRRRALAGLSRAAGRALSRCISRCHPGHGGSPAAEWIEHISDLAFHYLDLLDELGLDRVHLVGASFGGLDRRRDGHHGRVASARVAGPHRPGGHQGGRLDLPLSLRHGHPGAGGHGLSRSGGRDGPDAPRPECRHPGRAVPRANGHRARLLEPLSLQPAPAPATRPHPGAHPALLGRARPSGPSGLRQATWQAEIPGAALRVFESSATSPTWKEPDAVAVAILEFTNHDDQSVWRTQPRAPIARHPRFEPARAPMK